MFSVSAYAANDTTQLKPKNFAPESQHNLTFQTSLQFVASYHYAKPAINDAFSEKAFRNYLDNLDPQKLYFTQADIDNFKQYSTSIDDAMLNGNIQFLFDMFNTSQQRMFDRIDYATTLLRDSFDFTLQDSFEINREDAAYCKNFAEMDALWYSPWKFLREWAYAGFTFDFLGAIYGFIATGHLILPDIVMAPTGLLLCILTYYYWKKSNVVVERIGTK